MRVVSPADHSLNPLCVSLAAAASVDEAPHLTLSGTCDQAIRFTHPAEDELEMEGLRVIRGVANALLIEAGVAVLAGALWMIAHVAR